MSSKRELRSSGSTAAQALDATKLYKINASGAVVESTGTPGGTEIVFSGSKSSLRRLSDLERNVSILAAKAFTDDGSGSGETGQIDYAKTAGKWITARTLSLTGDVTGSANIDGSGNVSISTTVASNTVALGTDTTGNYMVNVSAGTGISVSHSQGEGSTATVSVDTSTIATKSYVDSAVQGKDNTDEITEGATNLYFTNARARSAVSASGSLSYNSSTGVFSYTTPSTSGITEGTNLYYTDARARAAVSFTAGSGAYNSSTGVFTIPTNTNQLTNGAGYVTSSGVTSVATGTGLSGGTITTTGTISLANTAVTAGSYTNASITVDAQGRLTSASSGTAPVTSVGATAPVVSSGGTTPTISMAAATASVNGYMTSTYAAKLDGIAAGATTNTGTVTSIATSNGISGGTITTTGTLSLSGSYSGTWAVTGAITATGEVTAYYSDANLKKDIVEIEDPVAKLMSIRGVTFRPNETALALGITDKEEVGVIAQEVEAVLPQLVTPSAFKGYKTVKYDKLTALLVEAVKAQQLQIDSLRAEIAKLGGSATTEL